MDVCHFVLVPLYCMPVPVSVFLNFYCLHCVVVLDVMCNIFHNSDVRFEDSSLLGCVPCRWVSRYRPFHSVESVSV